MSSYINEDEEVNPLMVAIIDLNPSAVHKLIENDDIHKYKNVVGPFGDTPYRHISLTVASLKKFSANPNNPENREKFVKNLQNATEILQLLETVPGIDKKGGMDANGNIIFAVRESPRSNTKGGKSSNKSRKQKTSKRRRGRTSKKNTKTRRGRRNHI